MVGLGPTWSANVNIFGGFWPCSLPILVFSAPCAAKQGAQKQGIREHLKVKKKHDAMGVGAVSVAWFTAVNLMSESERRLSLGHFQAH